MRVVVTILGVSGWSIGVFLIVRLRSTTSPSAVAFEEGSSLYRRLQLLLGRGAGALVGCLVAGVLVMGLGGRLMMRLLAASSSDEVQGAITDMDAVIGTVTVGGTFGFVAFIGAGAGVIGWLLRLVTRRWLPSRSLAAGILGSAIGAGLVARGSSLLEPTSRDFELLSPRWLAVALIIGLIVSFGMLLGVLSDRLADAWPPPGRGAKALWLAPLGVLIVVPPAALVVGVAAVARARWISLEGSSAALIDRIGRIVVLASAGVGGAWTLAAAAEIVAGP